jgi:hypothetical protein
MQLRQQPWDFDDFGTRVLPVEVPTASDSGAPIATDPLARIEQRLEELARSMNGLQRRLDSIDTALARFLAR